MHVANHEGLEDQQVQRALQERGGFGLQNDSYSLSIGIVVADL
jgi:hypothetical protein